MSHWNSMLIYLSDILGTELSNTFLKRIHFKEYQNENTMILIAEDSFTKGWFEETCIPNLRIFNESEGLVLDFRIEITKKERSEYSKSAREIKTFKKEDRSLSHDFLFEYYIPGDCNDFPYQAAKTVAINDNTKYNPLLIQGKTGAGKTHLAQAIVHEFRRLHPDSIAIYTTSEDFINEFVEHIQKKSMSAFREKYRHCDLLVVDDLQSFRSSQVETVKELENICNSLISYGSQMVFTSDRSHTKLKELSSRLRGRLAGGLSVDLQNPNFETRKAILIDMVQREGHKVDFKVIDLIAETVDHDIRELKGSLLKLFAFADLKKKEISLSLAKKVLSDKIHIEMPKNLAISEIQKEVARYYGIKASDIKSTSKLNSKTHPRQIAMYIASKYTNLTSTEIGNAFGKTHSTVLRSAQKITGEMDKNTNIKRDIEKIILELSEKTHI